MAACWLKVSVAALAEPMLPDTDSCALPASRNTLRLVGPCACSCCVLTTRSQAAGRHTRRRRQTGRHARKQAYVKTPRAMMAIHHDTNVRRLTSGCLQQCCKATGHAATQTLRRVCSAGRRRICKGNARMLSAAIARILSTAPSFARAAVLRKGADAPPLCVCAALDHQG